jgi:hypothetical protein
MSAATKAMQSIGLILLLASAPLRAGMLEDITRNVSDSVSNATRKGVDSLSQSVSSAIDKATTPADETAPATAPAAAATQAGQDKLAKGVTDFHKQCVNSSQLNGLHECECLTEGYRQRATRSGSTILSMQDQNELLATCPASHEVTKAWVFQSCDAFMQHKRSDHVGFCNCTGDRFATRANANPPITLRQTEAMRKEAMQSCGLADTSHNLR